MKKTTVWLLSAATTLVLGALGYYLFLPPMNVFSQGFWTFLFAIIAIFGVSYLTFSVPGAVKRFFGGSLNSKKIKRKNFLKI